MNYFIFNVVQIRFSATGEATDDYCPFDGVKFHTNEEIFENVSCDDGIEIKAGVSAVGLSGEFNPEHVSL